MPPETFYAIVGNNISRSRQDKNFTQAQLAKVVSLDRTSISNIEQGRQKVLLHSLYEIADALEVDLVSLLPAKNVLGNKTEYSIPEDAPSNVKTWLNTLITKKNNNEQ